MKNKLLARIARIANIPTGPKPRSAAAPLDGWFIFYYSTNWLKISFSVSLQPCADRGAPLMITIFTPFQVDPDKLETAKACIAAFVSEIEKNEPQTLIYRSYQDQNDPLRFIHFMQFQDAAAHERHRSSSYVQE